MESRSVLIGIDLAVDGLGGYGAASSFAPPEIRVSLASTADHLGPAELEEECLEMSPFLAILV